MVFKLTSILLLSATRPGPNIHALPRKQNVCYGQFFNISLFLMLSGKKKKKAVTKHHLMQEIPK